MEKGEEDSSADNYDSSDDDTGMVVDRIGPASAPPAGFHFVEEVPSLITEEDQLAILGKYVWHAWDVPAWHQRMVQGEDYASWLLG